MCQKNLAHPVFTCLHGIWCGCLCMSPWSSKIGTSLSSKLWLYWNRRACGCTQARKDSIPKLAFNLSNPEAFIQIHSAQCSVPAHKPNTLSLAGVAIEVLEELFVAPAPLIPKCNIVQWGDSSNIKQQRSIIYQGLMGFMPHLKTEENWLFISSFGSLYRRRQFRWGFSESNGIKPGHHHNLPLHQRNYTRDCVDLCGMQLKWLHHIEDLSSWAVKEFDISLQLPCRVRFPTHPGIVTYRDTPWHTVTHRDTPWHNPSSRIIPSRAAGVQCMLDSSW